VRASVSKRCRIAADVSGFRARAPFAWRCGCASIGGHASSFIEVVIAGGFE